MKEALFEKIGMFLGKEPRYIEVKDQLDEKLKQLKELGIPLEFINEFEGLIVHAEEVTVELAAQKAFVEGISMARFEK